MTQKYPCCSRITSEKIFNVEEKKSKLIFQNTSNTSHEIVKVDGCVIKTGIRCDFLVISEPNFEIFVELKGSDVNHAIEQLKASIEQLSINPKNHKKTCYIVSSRCPLMSTEIAKHKLYFKKHYSSGFEIKTRQCSVNV